MSGKKFQRRIENFICGHCGAQVTGNGYTNHCPICLYSRHVDIHPGDRAEECGGLMQPIGLEQKSDEWVLLHQCMKCNAQRRCKTNEHDTQGIVALARRLADQKTR